MTIVASSIITDAEIRFYDQTNLRVSPQDWLRYLNNAQRNLVLMDRRVFTVNKSILLVAGAKQTIPTNDGVALIDVVRNTGAAGTSPGSAITFVPMMVLNDSHPNWVNETPDATALHWTKYEDDELRFYVYPPQPSSPQYVEVFYSASPPEVADDQSDISLRDIYKEPLTMDMLRQAFMAETEVQDLKKAEFYSSQITALVVGG